MIVIINTNFNEKTKQLDCSWDNINFTLKISNENETCSIFVNSNIIVEIHTGFIKLTAVSQKKNVQVKKIQAILKTTESLIKKAIRGLFQKYKIYLKLKGLGFKARISEKSLVLKLGYSHDVVIQIPKPITVKIINSTSFLCFGSNWNNLTQFSKQIALKKKIEPYKGKGILLKNEHVIKKDGKKAKN